MAVEKKRTLTRIASVSYGDGKYKSIFFHAAAAAAATILTTGYFNDFRDELQVNDMIYVTSSADGAGDFLALKVSAATAGQDISVITEAATVSERAVVPTADGLTTGLIYAGDNTVASTSANADHILTLPAIASVPLGHTLKIFNGATACELRTPATSNTKINNTDADGSAEMAIPANSMTVVTKILADNWMAECYVAAGTRTIPTPDA